MKQLFAIDLHDYDGCTKVFSRPSARGIIIRNGKIALVYSVRDKYFKFPGGGIHGGEDKKTALTREVREEVGLTVIPESISEFGSVMRRQKSNVAPGTVFMQENFYYVCRVEDTIAEQKLDDYERDAEFTLQWTDIDEAIRVNDTFTSPDSFDEIMIRRELRVLQIIREAMIKQTLLPFGYVMRVFPDVEKTYSVEYSEALEELLAKHPESRFLKQLEAVSGAKESADEILAENDSPVVAPDDFGRDFIKLIQGIYEETELSTFADIMYRLWGTLPDGIKNTEPFITLCYADDPLSCGEEARTRRIYRNLFQYYDSQG